MGGCLGSGSPPNLACSECPGPGSCGSAETGGCNWDASTNTCKDKTMAPITKKQEQELLKQEFKKELPKNHHIVLVEMHGLKQRVLAELFVV